MKFSPPDGYEAATKNNATGAHGVPRTVVYHGSDGVWHAMHTAKDGTITRYPKDCAPHEVLAKFVFMFDGLLSHIYKTMEDKGMLVVDRRVEHALELHTNVLEKHYRQCYLNWPGDLVESYGKRTTAAEQGYKPEYKNDTLLNIDPPEGWRIESTAGHIPESTALVADWYPGHGFVFFLWIGSCMYYATELSLKKRYDPDMSKDPLARLVKVLPDHSDQFTPEYVAQQCAKAQEELYNHYGELRIGNYFRFVDGRKVSLESRAEEFLKCIPQKVLTRLWNRYRDNIMNQWPNNKAVVSMHRAQFFQVLEKAPREE